MWPSPSTSRIASGFAVAEAALALAAYLAWPLPPLAVTMLAVAALAIFLTGFAVTRLNTTEQRHVADLALSEQRASLAVAGARLAYFDVDVATGKGTVNHRWHELLGTSPDEVGDNIHDTWVRSLHPDDAQRVLEVGRRYKQGEQPDYEVEYRAITQQGETRWFASKGMLIHRRDGGQARMIGVFLDITASKTAELARHRAQEAEAHHDHATPHGTVR